MTHQNENADTPPVVETPEYENPPSEVQRTFIEGTNLIILVLAVVFVAIILIYIFTR